MYSSWNRGFSKHILKRLRGFGGAGNTNVGTVIIQHYNSAKNNTNKQENDDNQRLTKRNDAPIL